MLSVTNILSNIFTFLDDVISPPICAVCTASISARTVFCPTCSMQVRPISSINIHVYRYNIPIYAVGHYEGPLKSLICAKFQGQLYAAYCLGNLCAQELQGLEMSVDEQFDYVIPVPLHWARYVQRTYNQAEVMARQIVKQVNNQRSSNQPTVQLLTCIRRHVYTKYQFQLEREQRYKNVYNAFYVKRSYEQQLQGASILLVDDVYTTGATIYQLAKLLSIYKPKRIAVIVGARGA